MTWDHSKTAIVGGVLTALAGIRLLRGSKAPPFQDELLDRVLLEWNDTDRFTCRELLENVAAFGRTGSGKTSGMRTLAEAVVALRFADGRPASGGLILCPTAGDRAMWVAIFERAGRLDDLYIVEPSGNLRLNVLDYLVRRNASTREITQTVTTMAESIGATDAKSVEDGSYWKGEAARMIFNAVEVLRVAKGRLDPVEMKEFISGMAMTPQDLDDPAFQKGLHWQTMQEAHQKSTSLGEVERGDLGNAIQYFGAEMPALNDRTRSSITSHVNSVLHVFCTGVVRSLLATTTSVAPEVTLGGKFVMVAMPPNEFGDAGGFVNAAWKHLCQKRVLRRAVKPGDPLHVIWEDESAVFTSSFDGVYASQSRKFLGASVKISQSLPSYYAVLGGTQKGKFQADAMLASYSTKVLFALGDVDTAAWAQKLVGSRMQTTGGGTWSPQGLFDATFGYGNVTSSFNEHVRPILEARDFTTDMATGGPHNAYRVDCFVIKSGLPFRSTGDNWIRTFFTQRHP